MTSKNGTHPPNEEYQCRKPWPKTCTTVLKRTAEVSQFQVFCTEPKTFIQGQGSAHDLAEWDAWRQYQAIINCKAHIFEDRGYTTGVGWCIHCDMFCPSAFPPIRVPCTHCGQPTAFFQDADGGLWCIHHWRLIPGEKRTTTWRAFLNEPAALAGYIKEYRAKFEEPTV